MQPIRIRHAIFRALDGWTRAETQRRGESPSDLRKAVKARERTRESPPGPGSRLAAARASSLVGRENCAADTVSIPPRRLRARRVVHVSA